MKIHVVRQGDTLVDLAQKYNVPLERLLQANPKMEDRESLTIGSKIQVPTGKISLQKNKGEKSSEKLNEKPMDTNMKTEKVDSKEEDSQVAKEKGVNEQHDVASEMNEQVEAPYFPPYQGYGENEYAVPNYYGYPCACSPYYTSFYSNPYTYPSQPYPMTASHPPLPYTQNNSAFPYPSYPQEYAPYYAYPYTHEKPQGISE